MSDPREEALAGIPIAVVVPAYQAEDRIRDTLATIPSFVRRIYVVIDGATDGTAPAVVEAASADPRIVRIDHMQNRGVGRAMRSGYARALEDGAAIVAKMDADGQMDPSALASLILPVALGRADYAKGNRFVHSREIRAMPAVRLAGNAALSLISKLSTGYWNLLDPTNGYTAISREALTAIDFDELDDGFFFESSMLGELSLARAVTVDVAIPARYAGESSHLSVARSLLEFAVKHARVFLRRLWVRYVVLDFSAVSLLLAIGIPLAVFGILFGVRAWIVSSMHGVPATAGTVMVAAFTTAAGLFGIVQAMIYDILSVPAAPLTPPRIGIVAPSTAPRGERDGPAAAHGG
ncbi:MAG TPA: glycosyltransferase family 2 protein [Candidatus Limnocylindrales bacterium]|nr:glycosyltransferase family 2 protein [Candidatus Limnocylindrales bacterium]